MDNSYVSCKGMRCPYVNAYGEYEFWKDPSYQMYINHHGEHFSDNLAKSASQAMENRDGTEHYWSCADVVKALDKMSKPIPYGYRPCDAQYIANMMYADYFGSSVTSEETILKMACDYMSDPDGYKSKAFYHYVTDLMVKRYVIDWKTMV